MTTKHSHYFKDVARYETIDVYRVLQLFAVTDPCIQHAVKKLLVAGGRGVKNLDKDVQEAIDSLNRFLQMRAEDSRELPDFNVQIHTTHAASKPRWWVCDEELKCGDDDRCNQGKEFQ